MNKHSQTISFDRYLTDVRCSLGSSWKDKFNLPIKYFYNKMMEVWKELSREKEMKEEELVVVLLKRVRDSMKADWEHKIRLEKQAKSEEP